MHLTIVALGSYGDVRPVVALGVGLTEAGYQVRVASFRTYTDFIQDHGLGFSPIEGDPQQTLQGQIGQGWQESGRNPIKFITTLRKLYSPESLKKALEDAVEACKGTDGVLYTALGAAGYHVAEMMGIPRLYLLLQPISRTRERPSIFIPEVNLGPAVNWVSHHLMEQLMWQTLRAEVNHWRVESLKLPVVPFWGPFNLLYQQKDPFLFGYSEQVVPRPADIPDCHYITGYWFLQSRDDWTPPAGLERFLKDEPKPIYIGFGSMSGHVARDLVGLTIEALERSNQRAVLVGGWAGAHERDFPDRIYACDYAPHEWLFPQMAAVIHHGGAGTTAAGLRAGVPTIIIPFMGDQTFWGRRVYELGVGPEPVRRKGLTAETLAERINQALSDQNMIREAVLLGERIRQENGVEEAVKIISRYIGIK